MNKMAVTEYAEEVKTKLNLGLSDVSNCGIIKDKQAEVLYPAPADSECAHVYNVKDYGIKEGNDESLARDNTTNLKALITEIKKVDGLKKIVFPEGTYMLRTTIMITGLNDCYFCSDAPGKRFNLILTTWCQGISIKDCKNIHFNDYNFDYLYPSSVSGTVKSSDRAKGIVVVDIEDEFDLSNSNYKKGKIAYGSYMEFTEDYNTGKFYPDPLGNLLYNSTGDSIKSIKNSGYDKEAGELTITFADDVKLKPITDGKRVSICFTMYEFFGFHAEECENLYMESLNLYHTMGMAIGTSNCTNIYMNKVALTLNPNSKRLVTATADGFHPVGTLGEIKLTNCTFESSHDDCMNIKSWYHNITSVRDDGKVYYDPSREYLADVGDQIEIFDDFNMKRVGTFTIMEHDSKKHYFIFEENVKDYDIGKGYYSCNITKSPKLTIQNCYFGNKRNRGMLIQVRDVEISNCTFENIIMGPINLFSTPGDIFHEGVMPSNAVIKNNKFLNCEGTAINVYTESETGESSPGTIKNVQITNNFIYNNNGKAIRAKGTGDINIENNLIYCPRNVTGIEVRTSENVTIKGNVGYHKASFNLTDYTNDSGVMVDEENVANEITEN